MLFRSGALIMPPRTIPPPLNLLQELSRQAQDKLLLTQVVAEIQSYLRLIESVLEQFFRDPEKRSALLALEAPATQILGALELLNETRAAQSLKDCVDEIKRFSAPEYRPDPADFEGIAAVLSGFEFYVGQLVHGRDERLLSSGAMEAGLTGTLITPAATANTKAAEPRQDLDATQGSSSSPIADNTAITQR